MGLWSRLFGGGYDEYASFARSEIQKIRQDVAREYGTFKGPIAHKVGEACKARIRGVNEQAGIKNHKYGLALWQISMALHPDVITEADRPAPVKEAWAGIDG